MQHFSLAVIGSGSGNIVVPEDRSQGPVAVIEAGAFGGTCINRGCIPSKILVYTAEVADGVRHAPEFGLGAALTKVDWPAIRDRTFDRIDHVSAAGRRARAEQDGVTLFAGHARFAGPRELVIDDDIRITADQIVLATGASPVIPPVIADAGVDFHTSDTIMRIDELPARLVIVGGGYIAAEFAHVFSSLGVDVRLVSMGPELVENFDPAISKRFTELARQRWDVRLSATVTGVHRRDAEVTVELEDGTTVTGDLLLVATGRRPNTDDLGLDLAGVKRHEDGRIEVDAYGRTAAAGVWSLGDASSPFELKHVANAEARALAHNLTNPQSPRDLRPYPHDWVPSAVFTEPQIATVGARRQDLVGHAPFAEAVHEYADTAYGWAMQEPAGFCQLYGDPATGKLLGAHIIGYQASLLIQPLVQGATFGQQVSDLARGQYWIHPALAEVVENALLKLSHAMSG